MPTAHSNAIPHTTDRSSTAYVAPAPARRRRSRTRVYTIGAFVFLAISIGGYIGFRAYIYGDNAPPIPVLDD
jgi:hypothetical protein